jgi:hypothetical protein
VVNNDARATVVLTSFVATWSGFILQDGFPEVGDVLSYTVDLMVGALEEGTSLPPVTSSRSTKDTTLVFELQGLVPRNQLVVCVAAVDGSGAESASVCSSAVLLVDAPLVCVR